MNAGKVIDEAEPAALASAASTDLNMKAARARIRAARAKPVPGSRLEALSWKLNCVAKMLATIAGVMFFIAVVYGVSGRHNRIRFDWLSDVYAIIMFLSMLGATCLFLLATFVRIIHQLLDRKRSKSYQLDELLFLIFMTTIVVAFLMQMPWVHGPGGHRSQSQGGAAPIWIPVAVSTVIFLCFWITGSWGMRLARKQTITSRSGRLTRIVSGCAFLPGLFFIFRGIFIAGDWKYILVGMVLVIPATMFALEWQREIDRRFCIIAERMRRKDK